jgi:hypothetical protein
LEDRRLLVSFDDRVDVLENTNHGPVRLDFTKLLYGQDENVGVFAKKGDVAGSHDMPDNLVHHRAFAGPLRAMKQIAPAMKEPLAFELRALRPEFFDFRKHFRRQAAGKIQQIVDVQALPYQLNRSLIIAPAIITSGRQSFAC